MVHVYKRDKHDEFVHPGDRESDFWERSMNNNNGKKVLQLPPGFKFEPTDEEVVFEYLKSKVFCLPPPPYSLISDVDPYLLYHSHPSTLLFPPHPQGVDNEDDQEGYFFCKRSSEYDDGSFCNGWNWKVGGDDDEQILPTTGRAGDMMIGMKRTLVLHRGNIAMTPPHWVMHQYHLLPAPTNYYPNYHHQFNTQLLHQNEWVLCHVFQKKQSSSRLDQQQSLSIQYRHQNYNDYDDDDGSDDNLSSSSSPPTSRCSSAVTDEDDEEEEVVSRW